MDNQMQVNTSIAQEGKHLSLGNEQLWATYESVFKMDWFNHNWCKDEDSKQMGDSAFSWIILMYNVTPKTPTGEDKNTQHKDYEENKMSCLLTLGRHNLESRRAFIYINLVVFFAGNDNVVIPYPLPNS